MRRKPIHQHTSGIVRTVYSPNVPIVTCVLPTGRNHQRERKRRTTVISFPNVLPISASEVWRPQAHPATWTWCPGHQRQQRNLFVDRVNEERHSQRQQQRKAVPASVCAHNHNRHGPLSADVSSITCRRKPPILCAPYPPYVSNVKITLAVVPLPGFDRYVCSLNVLKTLHQPNWTQQPEREHILADSAQIVPNVNPASASEVSSDSYPAYPNMMCAPQTPYTSMMIFRPVKSATP